MKKSVLIHKKADKSQLKIYQMLCLHFSIRGKILTKNTLYLYSYTDFQNCQVNLEQKDAISDVRFSLNLS